MRLRDDLRLLIGTTFLLVRSCQPVIGSASLLRRARAVVTAAPRAASEPTVGEAVRPGLPVRGRPGGWLPLDDASPADEGVADRVTNGEDEAGSEVDGVADGFSDPLDSDVEDVGVGVTERVSDSDAEDSDWDGVSTGTEGVPDGSRVSLCSGVGGRGLRGPP